MEGAHPPEPVQESLPALDGLLQQLQILQRSLDARAEAKHFFEYLADDIQAIMFFSRQEARNERKSLAATYTLDHADWKFPLAFHRKCSARLLSKPTQPVSGRILAMRFVTSGVRVLFEKLTHGGLEHSRVLDQFAVLVRITKLDANGNNLPDSDEEWVMVRDNETGLIWEVKKDDGSIHDMEQIKNGLVD